ncbi:MAG: AAA family ATPase, partial [Clostridia bacterium]|nr:AAA family ATPase [Clostridia bacterium]
YQELGVATPRGLLLHGAPGVGKTLMATCVVEESGRRAYTCRKTKSSSDFVNEISSIFAEAKNNTPSIVFLDDMDKFANEDSCHKNADEFVTLQACIDDIKNSEVFVLATANELDNLPESLLRAGRFDKVMHIFAPDRNDGVKIVEYYLKQKNCLNDIELENFARLLVGNSCAEIETVINDAGVIAAFENKSAIGKEDLLEACMQMVFKAPKSSVPHDPEILEKVAYHEAGHAVVAELLEAGSVTVVSVCRHCGEIGGITSFYKNANFDTDIIYKDNRVIALLAGRAAYEIKYGEIDVGASGDLRSAFHIVERGVENFCEDGFDTYYERPVDENSDSFRLRREIKIQSKLSSFYRQARKLLIKNREFLDKLAEALIEKHTLMSDDIQAIKATCTLVQC